MAGAVALPAGVLFEILLLVALFFAAVFFAHFVWWLGSNVPVIGGWIQQAAGAMENTVRGIVTSIGEWAYGWVRDNLIVVNNRVRAVSDQLALAAIEFGNNLLVKYRDATSKAWSWATAAYNNAVAYVDDQVDTLNNSINWVYQQIGIIVNAAIRSLVNDFINPALNAIRSAISSINDFINGLRYQIDALRDYVNQQLGEIRATITGVRDYLENLIRQRETSIRSDLINYVNQQVGSLSRDINARLDRELNDVNARINVNARAIEAVREALQSYLKNCGNPLCNAYLPIVDALLDAEQLAEAGLIIDLLFTLASRNRDVTNAIIDLGMALGNDVKNQVPRP